MKTFIATITLWMLFWVSGCSQDAVKSDKDKIVGGGCEDCALIYEAMPASLSWKTTIAESSEPGERMIISGTIYKKDGHTPAPNVILYVYHTDNEGIYSPAPGQKAKRHGHLRGWIKTDATGKYEISSIRPASYPGRKFAAHIHPIIKEPGIREYWIDEFQFDDDPLLTSEERSKLENRGGNGVIKMAKNGQGVWIGKRDIVLGLNVPGY